MALFIQNAAGKTKDRYHVYKETMCKISCEDGWSFAVSFCDITWNRKIHVFK